MKGSDRKLSTDDLASSSESGASERDVDRRSAREDATVADELQSSGERGEPTRLDTDDDGVSDDRAAAELGGGDAAGNAAADSEPLLVASQADEFRARWERVQTSFVDEPRSAVEEADALVADLMQRLAETFSQERKSLEGQWDRGDDVSTEDLRVALQRYRSFFDRLLST